MHSGEPSVTSRTTLPAGTAPDDAYFAARPTAAPVARLPALISAPPLVRVWSAARIESFNPTREPMVGSQAFAVPPMNVRPHGISVVVASTTLLMDWTAAAHFDMQPVVHEPSIASFIEADVSSAIMTLTGSFAAGRAISRHAAEEPADPVIIGPAEPPFAPPVPESIPPPTPHPPAAATAAKPTMTHGPDGFIIIQQCARRRDSRSILVARSGV